MPCCPRCGYRVVTSQEAWQQARLAAGDCAACGEPRERRDWRYCDRCTTTRRAGARRRYRQQVAKKQSEAA